MARIALTVGFAVFGAVTGGLGAFAGLGLAAGLSSASIGYGPEQTCDRTMSADDLEALCTDTRI